MPRTIRRRVRVGPDRILHIQLPDDIEPGEVDVTVQEREAEPPMVDDDAMVTADAIFARLLDPSRMPTSDPEERRRAARAGLGILADESDTLDDFLKERRDDDARRDRALGL